MLFDHSVETWVVFCSTRIGFPEQVRESIFKGVVSIVVAQCSTSLFVLIRYHFMWKRSVTALAV